MLEHISNIIRRVMDHFYAPMVDDEAFMQDVIRLHWRNQFAEDICNHNREEDGYCAKCHGSK